MGFLDFFKYRKKNNKENIVNSLNSIKQEENYPLKGLTRRGVCKVKHNESNPWMAYMYITIKGKRHQVHLGYFPSREVAQKARWEFIENLK